VSVRSVVVRLQAEVAQYVKNTKQAEKATEDLAKAQDKAGKATDETGKRSQRSSEQTRQGNEKASESAKTLGKYIKDNGDAMEEVGDKATTFGLGIVAAFGVATKAAMDWESAWAGVTKTVDGSPAQMAELEQGLRDLATELPLAHTEIAGVAEAAGQLGIAREDVLGFTRTMIMLGDTTNLTAEEAATDIAQIANVMGTLDREGTAGIERFGATLVALGNDGASTEKEILSMAQRIAGAGATVGATETEVLALANTLASMGVRAELGGGVTTRVLLKMFSAIKSGGTDLQNWANVAGQSASDFAAAFEDSPVRALGMVTAGLKTMNESGGNVVATMKDLGIEGTEETQVMLALAASGNLLNDSLDLGARAWQQNLALVEEADKRYDTTAAKVQTAWNRIMDAAIDAGSVILPVLASGAEAVANFADMFAGLPGPVQTALVVVGGLAGTAALVGGAFLTLLPKAQRTSEALRSLGTGGEMADRGLRKLGKAAGVAGAIATVTTVLATLATASYMEDIDTGMGRIADTFADVEAGAPGASAALDTLFQKTDGSALVGDIDSFGDAVSRLFADDPGTKFDNWGQRMVNRFMPSVKGSLQITEEAVGRLDQQLSTMVSGGNLKGASEVFDELTRQAEAQGVSLEELVTKFPQYGDALRQAAADQKNAAAGADGVTEGLEGVEGAAGGAAVALEDYLDMLFQTGILTRDVRAAEREYEEALDSVSAALEKNGQTLDRTTEAGRENEAILDGIANAGQSAAEAMAAHGASQDEVRERIARTYKDTVAAAESFGLLGEDAHVAAREILGIPPGVSVETWMDSFIQEQAERDKDALDQIPGEKNVNITDGETITTLSGKLGQLHEQIRATPNKENILTEPMSPQIRAGLEALGYIVETLPNGNIKVTETGTDATGKKIDDTARKERIADINARALTEAANTALNKLAEPRDSFINVMFRQLNDPPTPAGGSKPVGTGTVLRPQMEHGGRIPAAASGMRLPLTGPGTAVVDGFLGIGADGMPTVRADAGEWIINGRSSEKYDRLLAAINRDDPWLEMYARSIPGLADGARIGREMSTSPAPAFAALPTSGPQEFTGNLFLDSGEFLGAVRGVAQREAVGVVERLDTTIDSFARRGVYTGGGR